MRSEQPATREEAASILRAGGPERARVRIVGAGTKIGWGAPVRDPDVELSTTGLNRLLEHNAGDLTAVIEAGVPLAEAQAAFENEGQMLALDPPLGDDERATVGGVFATADAGPRRHRYGAPRDLIVGITVALSDGTLAKAGGKVIKNVAGYDLAKLFTGSFGTLGLIVDVSVRLHPLPSATATAAASAEDADAVARGAGALSHASIETEGLDIGWRRGRGGLLARFGGATAVEQARGGVALLERAGLDASVVEDDESLWAEQRRHQRSSQGVVVRVSAAPTELPRVIRVTEAAGATLVGRAALGVSWITLPPAATEEAVAKVEDLRRELAPYVCAVLDAPADVRARLDVWGVADGAAVELMRRTKSRFDAQGTCNRGLFVGGI